MTEELLVDSRETGIAVLTLNRPEKLNAVTIGLQRELDSALTGLAEDEAVRCVVLTGAGDRAFCAGYDVHEMAPWSADELLVRLLEREELIWRVAAHPKPIIAALNGLTFGVGAILASAVDIRVGGPATVWRFTSSPHNGANATWTLPSLIGRGRAAEILMSSREVHAEEAERIGLLEFVVSRAEEVLSTAVSTAEAIAANPPGGVQAIKRLLREENGRSTHGAFTAENLTMRTELRPRPISELYSAFIAKRDG